MSPRRSHKKKSDENKNNERVQLSEEIKHYLTISPYVSVPQITVTTVLREDGKPAVSENGSPLYSLPASKNSILAGIFTKSNLQKPRDIRDDDSKKAAFLSALDLIDTETANRIAIKSKEDELAPSLLQKLKSRKGQAVSFFKNNPVPLSSALGKKIVRSGIGRCNNPKEEVERYEKYCTSAKFRNHSNLTSWPQVNVRRAKLKPGQHAHRFSYGRRQRITRKVELTIGLSTKSFSLLNSCRDCHVRVRNLTDDEVARKMQNLLNAQSVDKQTPKLTPKIRDHAELRWIASEPTAGPSRGIERIATPVIQLYDIRNSPSKAKYFQ
ncbi:unnamed protein product [Allacma fusca]|uniref:Uncharacterized protein n=1 Tax=Allacma fusca TaxID=39272 RepID=A0A8J2PNG1_9HEXA|nr:unnamed protein product [Allacma fusca]